MLRMIHKREYYIPESATAHDCGESDAAIYTWTDKQGRPCAMGFHGRAQKPDFHHHYRSEERRAEHMANFIAGRLATAKSNAEHKAKRDQPSKLEVGQILNTCWGYDQTNREFYQVTKTIGARTVEIREIASESESTGWATGKAVAVKDQFIGEPMRRRVSYGDTVAIESFIRATPWDGKPAHWSAYA